MRLHNIETGEVKPLLLMPGSLLVLSGEARYQWQHEIRGRKVDHWEGKKMERLRRVSLTFRKVILATE
jgi:alkylated DNA repair dioxygenase AlkB